MKKLILLLLLLVPLIGLQPTKGCNLSEVSLIGITPGPGPNTTITFRLCIGYGITGSTKGADNSTAGISFGWYTTVASPSFSIISYTPTSISSAGTTTPACTMPSFNLANPPGPVFTGVDVGTFFTLPGSCTNRFLCVNSTANCGNVPMVGLCFNFSFVVNYVPDSMRVFGVEGAGNAVAGCYPNPDMLIDFDGGLPIAIDDAKLGYTGFRSWPNPVNDIVHLEFDCPRPSEDLRIYVTDVNGRIVKEIQYNAVYGMNYPDMDLSALNVGIYFLWAENSQGRAIKRIVKL